jgi:2-polyprenyl-3-methyl-5-hydroxy-6-metoxy-1,4-benzoquinol methylase
MTDNKHIRCLRAQSIYCSACLVGTKNGYTLEFCNLCRHAFISDNISKEDLARFYAESTKYSASSFSADIQNQSFPGSRSDAYRYLRMIKAASSSPKPCLLEVGAGWGYASERATQMGWEADVIEYANDCIVSMRERLPDQSIIFQGSFEEFSTSCNRKYDAILMSQVLEHALSPLIWLKNAYALLNPGGVLLVAVPQYQGFYRVLGLKDPFITPPEHLNYFTKDSLQLVCRENGFVRQLATGYSRIPYHNIKRRFNNPVAALFIYRCLQSLFCAVDLFGASMIQIQVFKKIGKPT